MPVSPLVLRTADGERPFRVARLEVDLPGVSHLWSVDHALPAGVDHQQEVLSAPAVNVTVERLGGEINSWAYGPVSARFARTLSGVGRTVGIQFRPGGFAGLTDVPMTDLVDTRLPLAEVLPDWPSLEPVLDAPLEAVEELLAFLPDDDGGALVDEALRAAASPDLTRVDQLAATLGVSPRTLQRRFTEQLGLSPKWALRRARVSDLLARIEAGEDVDWATAAIELGFSDQAHLTNTFTELVGVPPAAYSRR